MVTVAKSLDGPIKILFPRSLTPDPETGKLEMSLLGLGDIVIPGFFLALLLRFDAHVANAPYFPTNIHYAFPKPYFHSALVGYIIGLATTLYVMIGEYVSVFNTFRLFSVLFLFRCLSRSFCCSISTAFQAAQPALLYLVPACLGSSLLCAVVRGELKELFDYSEEEEEKEEDEKKKEEEEKKETKKAK